MAAGKVEDISQVTVSAKVLSEIIGVSDRRIRQLAEEGILVKASQGRYKLLDSMKGYILNLKVALDSKMPSNLDDGEVDLYQEKALHERVKRHITELKLHLMEGKVHQSEDVEAVMTDMLLNIKTKLLSLPSKLTPLLVDRQDPGYVKDAITNEILLVLEELSDYKASDFYGKEYIDTDEIENEEVENDEE